MVHYIGLGGFQGITPNYTEVHGSFEAAVADLAGRFDLEVVQLEELSIDGHVGLDIEHQQAEYLEIVQCNCDLTKFPDHPK